MMMRFAVACWISLFLASGAVCATEDTVSQDAFCGSIAAKACVEHLGFRWRQTAEVRALEDMPICRFSEIQAAVESLGLHAFPYPAKRDDLPELRRILNRQAANVAAVIWDRGNAATWIQTGESIGHFMTLTGISEDQLVCFDGQDGQVHRRELADNQAAYLLLVSGSPIEVQNFGYGKILTSGIQSVVTLPFILLACVLVTLSFWQSEPKSISHRRKLPLFSAVSFVRGGLIVALLGGVCVAGYALIQSKRFPKSHAAASPAKQVVFQGEEVSLGSIIIGSGEKHQIHLVNQTDRVVRIDDIVPSCGCVLIDPRQMVLQPNEAHKVDIQITAANLGENTHQLTVKSNQATIDEATLAFDGVNGPRLLPRMSLVGVISAQKKNRLVHNLELENIETSQVKITKVELLQDDAPIEIDLSSSDESNSQEEPLQIGIVLKEKSKFRGLFYSNIRVSITDNSGRVSTQMTPMLAQIGVEIVD